MTPPLLSSAQKDNIAADGASTIFLVQWSANGCTNLALPPVNFTSMDLAKCVANFLTPIDDCKLTFFNSHKPLDVREITRRWGAPRQPIKPREAKCLPPSCPSDERFFDPSSAPLSHTN
jgi:hypothetical protein